MSVVLKAIASSFNRFDQNSVLSAVIKNLFAFLEQVLCQKMFSSMTQTNAGSYFIAKPTFSV